MAVTWSVNYAEAERMLASLHGASGDIQKMTFRARLKHLKRLGIPLHSSPGRGKKIRYFDDQLYQWAFCLELAEFGVDPTVVAGIVETEWISNISDRFQEALKSPSDVYFAMCPRMMSNIWEPQLFELKWLDMNQTTNFLHRLKGSNRRAILINISDLAQQIHSAGLAFYSARHSSTEP
jgi:hypothetical protein